MVDIAEVLIRIKGDASSLTSASEKAKGNFSSMESGAKSAFSNIGSMATAGMGIAAAAIAAFAIKSFQDVDGAYKGIQKSVGATADQMNTTLKPAFDSVFGNFPVKADEAAAAVTKVYSGLKNLSDGLVPTAAQLTDVTSKFSELAAVGGTKVETLTTRLMPAFKALGVSANEIPAALNSIVIAAQGTGDKVDTLTASVAKAAPTFKQFGFGIEDTAAVMAKLDVSGVNSSQVITGLNKVLKEAATSGEPPKKALADLEDQLKKGNLTGKEATALYKELGVKGFAAFRTAVQGGAFDVQALTGAMGANTTQLDASYEAQRTFSDKLTEFKNKLELAFAPLGKTLITLMENVLTAVEPVLPIITGLVSAFSKLPMPIQLVGIAFVGLLGGMGMLNVVLGKFGTSVTKLPGDIEKLIPTIKNLASSMSNVPSKVLNSAAASAAKSDWAARGRRVKRQPEAKRRWLVGRPPEAKRRWLAKSLRRARFLGHYCPSLQSWPLSPPDSLSYTQPPVRSGT